MSRKDEAALKDEISILLEMPPHDNIVRLIDTYCEPAAGYYYLVMEKVDGGELFDRIVAKETYSEKEARDVCSKIFQAIRHCHDHKIAHRDLKPENLLLKVSCFGQRSGVECFY